MMLLFKEFQTRASGIEQNLLNMYIEKNNVFRFVQSYNFALIP